ncbi:MAG: alanine racemase [Bacteroidetes bacterium]|nr:MAG: alanine racemase [Bacteroidota bacterium]
MKRRDFIQKAVILSAGASAVAGVDAMGITLTHTPELPTDKKMKDLMGQYDPWMEINTEHIKWNIEQIRKITGNRPICAVIKCNAYGHGTAEMGKFLESIGIQGMAVVKIPEALELRNKGVKSWILNLGPYSKEETKILVEHDIMPSVYNDTVFYLNETARQMGKIAGIHLKIDTGLGRVGIPYYDATPFIEKLSKLSNIKIHGILTSFTEEKEFDKEQLKNFNEVVKKANEKGIDVGIKHCVSSDGICTFPDAYLDAVRPGILIYGHYPNDAEYKLQRIQVKPALTIKCRVAQVKKLRKGDSVSYHKAYTADAEQWIATLPIGGYDGLPRSMANNADVLINGKRYPLIAGMTSDHSYTKFENAEEVKTGDEAVILGRQGNEEIKAEDILSKLENSSVYRFLIDGMNPLIPKVYI